VTPARIAFVLAALGAAGCALTTPAPAGPIHPGQTTVVDVGWAMAYGRANAVVGGVAVAGNGQATVFGQPRFPLPDPLPLTAGVRQSLGGDVEASADVGWMDSGVGLRARVPGIDRPAVPVVLALGARDGRLAAVPSDTYAFSAGLEAYPRLAPMVSGYTRHLIVALGIAGGVFQHQMNLPDQFDSGSDAPHDVPSLTVVRPELRLQTALGLHLGRGAESLSVAVAPWFLLASGTPVSMTCNSCNSSLGGVQSFDQSWGVSLFLTPSFGWLRGV
jgi:hypothetical protein